MSIKIGPAIPVLRIFSEEKAREFYLEFLGFTLEWEHRFEDNAPLFMQVRRGDLVLRLSEHYGDGSPGASLTASVDLIDQLHVELNGKKYKYMRPGIENTPWKTRDMTVIDPFGNRICFSQIC